MVDVELYVGAIAQMCHEANRAWCAHWGSDIQPSWGDAPKWQRDSALDGVKHVVKRFKEGHRVTPRELHENWMSFKLSSGWKYAAQKNAQKKEHNCLRPYDELNPKEKLKDKLFLAIVFSFLDE